MLSNIVFFNERPILLNKWFYWTNDCIEPMILLDELFYWTNDFTQRTMSLYKQIVRKRIILKTEIMIDWKSMNERESVTNDKITNWKRRMCRTLIDRARYEQIIDPKVKFNWIEPYKHTSSCQKLRVNAGIFLGILS